MSTKVSTKKDNGIEYDGKIEVMETKIKEVTHCIVFHVYEDKSIMLNLCYINTN